MPKIKFAGILVGFLLLTGLVPAAKNSPSASPKDGSGAKVSQTDFEQLFSENLYGSRGFRVSGLLMAQHRVLTHFSGRGVADGCRPPEVSYGSLAASPSGWCNPYRPG